MFLSSVSSSFFQLRPISTSRVLGSTLEVEWDAYEGRLGLLLRNLRTMKVAHWVDVSQSSGADSPGLSRIKGH